MLRTEKAAILAAVFAAAVSALGIASLVGHPARLVELITLFAGGFGSGASLVAAIVAHRHARQMQLDCPPKPPEQPQSLPRRID